MTMIKEKTLRYYNCEYVYLFYSDVSTNLYTGITNLPCAFYQMELCPLDPRSVESPGSQEKNDRRHGEPDQSKDSPCPVSIQQFTYAKAHHFWFKFCWSIKDNRSND